MFVSAHRAVSEANLFSALSKYPFQRVIAFAPVLISLRFSLSIARAKRDYLEKSRGLLFPSCPSFVVKGRQVRFLLILGECLFKKVQKPNGRQ